MKNVKKTSCPCTHLIIPCDPDCTCCKPLSSKGCRYCASYGSEGQRMRQAMSIAVKLGNAAYMGKKSTPTSDTKNNNDDEQETST